MYSQIHEFDFAYINTYKIRYIWNDHIVSRLLKDSREMGFKGTIVLGGPQITYSDKEDNLENLYPQADAFVLLNFSILLV